MVGEDLCGGFLAAGIPIKKLENPVFREVLESNLGIKLQHEKLFRIKHIPKCYKGIMECIKEDLKEGPAWGTWVDAASFYAKHLSELEPVINSFGNKAARNISELEEAGLTLHNSLAIVSMTQDKIKSIPGSKGNIFKEKLVRVLAKNPGLKTLKEVDLVIQGQLQT
ncbi:hypothetical protein TCAL_13228 [Tigriopus californicus]|uniref:Uncharacterized protein n=1 Tax=Tigriopus californicus TaxID=6832 RepID=A0A553P2R6_TIGCA|nr:hypothetical protein TCAL_13228 [Tigriopus californicus]|eukprot:TCALIF_13228-PA protein Name:"Protein of unknown function" AED:0.30 eAED:0.30 QI:0/0/0/1/1/1/3/0/166